jgi:hypothetical protein
MKVILNLTKEQIEHIKECSEHNESCWIIKDICSQISEVDLK